jgi:hypothetical protein
MRGGQSPQVVDAANYVLNRGHRGCLAFGNLHLELILERRHKLQTINSLRTEARE